MKLVSPVVKATEKVAYVNARLLDPASGLDQIGDLLTEGGRIADHGPELFADGVPAELDLCCNLVQQIRSMKKGAPFCGAPCSLRLQPQVFMESKKSLFVFVCFSLAKLKKMLMNA